MKKLAKLQEELSNTENRISELKYEETQKERLEQQIDRRKYIFRKISYKTIYDNMEKILTLFPHHYYDKDKIVNIKTEVKSMNAIVKNKFDENCSDTNPYNIEICERCAVLYFKSIIEKEIANYYLEGKK